ncbi:hypothetical protein Halru_2126 [Halovivax ruber XH-70]|uniref:Uncharacterized protein n=1 Tax=Halovivax ruber (strain DSM 18193 / JCM 13892 / XH-70) TaxID=797302 RepID=L0IAV3_HALRX|nr:hypothetical protein [Halovivax ruber]AGB16715.1 hypothetical protein Halru_2126 [Halovivax ruber XH-70]
MGRYDFDEPRPDDPCPRCGVDLERTYWARLRAVHDGRLSDRYRNSEKRLCVDCLAALGMLEFDMGQVTGGGGQRSA